MSSKDRPKSGQPLSNDPAMPKATIGRLSLYLRHIEQLLAQGQETISSNRLGDALDISDAQVRKDLGHFGPMGYPGVGYRIPELRDRLRAALGTNRTWNVALIGMGNLGRALFGYGGFLHRGFVVTALFDNDARLVGTEHAGMKVHAIDDLNRLTRDLGLQLAILAVPIAAADEVARKVEEAGISGILNFAPVRLNVKKDVSVVSVDLGLQLEQLAFLVNRKIIPGEDVRSVDEGETLPL